MALSSVLRHRAVRVRTVAFGQQIEGTQETRQDESRPIPVVVFPPGTPEANRSGRRLEAPLLLFRGVDVDGAPVDLRPEDRVVVTDASGQWTEEVHGEYQVASMQQPLGRPGRRPRAYSVTLRRALGSTGAGS